MRANEFEKQVQQKMDELQLRPSPEVWDEVEKQIRRDKKRRRIIFWWLLPILLTGGIAFFILQNENKNSIAESTQHNQTTSPTSTPEESKITPSIQTNTNSENNNNESGSSNPNQDKLLIGNENDVLLNRQPEQKLKTVRPFSNKPFNKPGEIKPATSPINTDQAIPSNTQQPGIINNDNKIVVKDDKADKDLLQTKPAEPLIADSKIDQIKTDSNTLAAKPKEEEKKETIPDPAITSNNKKEKDPKWEFAVEARAGMSNTWKGELFHLKKVVEVYSASPNIGTGTTAGPFAPTVLIESPEQAFSGGLHLTAQRKLSTRLAVNLGVQYNYLSTRVKVGSEVQSSRYISNDFSSSILVNSYYRPEGNSDYINRYHLLGLTAGLSWKLIEWKKFSLSWDNTVSVDRLLSTNALLFDGGIRGYYRDFSAFRKTHYFISSGLSLPIWKSKRVELSLRPTISYGITPVLKNSSDKNMHFLHYGAGLRFLFPGKK